MRSFHLVFALLLLSFASVACGSESASAPTATSVPTSVVVVEATPTETPADTDAAESEPEDAVDATTEEISETEQADDTSNMNESAEDDGMMTGNGDADVEFVRVAAKSDGTYTFHVTVAHLDTGWEDYADGWDVVLPDGTVLKRNDSDPFTRLLLHPHETEQPFTRSQSGLLVPEGVTSVTVRAHDLVDGFGGREVVVDLTADSGELYSIER